MNAYTSSKATSVARIGQLAARAERWMMDQAFPFWAERTPDPAGGFHERLDLDGQPVTGEPSRVRLQARMAYTFALAADMGWDQEQARRLSLRGVDTLVQHCRREDGLFGKLVQPGRGLVDDTAEAYDTAFALLAFATVEKAFGSAGEAGSALSQTIESLLRRETSEGGYRERLPAPQIREQNPHMHLTEASLAWFEATGDQHALDRAKTIIAFVREQFWDDASGLLLEYSGGPSPDNRTEAGHMFEWVWILGRLRALTGEAPLGFMQALHSGGMRLLEGLDYLPLSQHCDGSVREAKQRTWGPTEKLKAHIAMWHAAPDDELLMLIANSAEGLFQDHVEQAIPGAWIDAIAPDRSPLITDITPATGYHIFLAFRELIDLSSELKA